MLFKAMTRYALLIVVHALFVCIVIASMSLFLSCQLQHVSYEMASDPYAEIDRDGTRTFVSVPTMRSPSGFAFFLERPVDEYWVTLSLCGPLIKIRREAYELRFDSSWRSLSIESDRQAVDSWITANQTALGIVYGKPGSDQHAARVSLADPRLSMSLDRMGILRLLVIGGIILIFQMVIAHKHIIRLLGLHPRVAQQAPVSVER